MCGCWWALVRENHRLQEELRAAHAQLATRKHADAWRAAERAGDAVAARYECKVCMARPLEVVFLPCGHSVCCATCAPRQHACPVCDEPILMRSALYLV